MIRKDTKTSGPTIKKGWGEVKTGPLKTKEKSSTSGGTFVAASLRRLNTKR